MFARIGVPKATWLVALVLLFPACATADDNTTAPTTGKESSFQVTGDVSAVDVEDVDVDVDASIGPDGFDVNPSGSVTVQVTIKLESINDEAAELCEVQAGGDAVLVVNDDTDLAFDRPLTELDTLRDESVTATGTARELAGQTVDAADPGAACILTAVTLALAEEPGDPATTAPAP